jgi:hypothetical protein
MFNDLRNEENKENSYYKPRGEGYMSLAQAA